MKPLGIKNYGSIPHLSGSRLGEGDYTMQRGQEVIATKKTRDKWDLIIVQEKLDGSNVGVCKIDEMLAPIQRAGYMARSSPYKTHHLFADWAQKNASRFDDLLKEGERLVGEWMYHAVGTKYILKHEPFVAFDIMIGQKRLPYLQFIERVSKYDFITPELLHLGQPINIKDVEKLLGPHGHHGAIDACEGAVWRVERKGMVDFLGKYVRKTKEDGSYLDQDIINETEGK